MVVSFRKAFVPVIVVALLSIVLVASFFYFQDWFYYYKSDIEATQKIKDFEDNLEIVKVDGTDIYIKNDFSDNLVIDSVKINDVECSISGNTIDKGSSVVMDIGSCATGLNTLTPYDVIIITKYGLKAESEILRNIP